MNATLARRFLAVGVLAAMPMLADAAIVTYSFNLDGSQETPPNGSLAAGSAQVTIDDVLDTISFAAVALNLQGSPVAAHIHVAPAGVAGPVVFDLAANLDAFGPVTIGPIVLANSVAFGGEGKALPAGLGALINAAPWEYYLNLHTDLFPGGEIRGQLAAAPVPVPAAVWLFGSALAGLGVVRRRFA